jgi:hypothetical protein
MAPTSAYDPLGPARRPGPKPTKAPRYRVLVHKRFRHHYDELVGRVGLQQASQLWDHLAMNPGNTSATAATCYLRGRAGKPQGPGWSRTIHYEVTSSARVDYQYHDAYCTRAGGDPHRVVAILTISYSSH